MEKPLLVPFTKKNPDDNRVDSINWRSEKAVKKSAEARRRLKKPAPRVLERLNK